MKIKTIKNIPNLEGKAVLLRVDFNVPLDEQGEVKDDTRITEALPTIKLLLEKNARIILMSHLGRPKGQYKDEFRLTKVAKHLEKLLGKTVKKLDEVIGPEVEKEVNEMQNGDLLMLENLRCEEGEESCDPEFTKNLAALGDLYINDAFGTAHRRHASTAGLADYLPAYAGLLMEKEINALSPLLHGEPDRPLTMIFGGAKIDTKIGVIKNFLKKADYFLMGGALANTFLAAAGYNIGDSLYEEDKLDIAREIMLECEKQEEKFLIPTDVVVADEISETADTIDMPIEDVMGKIKILDIGKHTADKYCQIIEKSGTVIWNGPLGLSELKPFKEGTKTVAQCLAAHKCTSIIGGGDTAEAIHKLGLTAESFSHISTGGGAAIEFLSGEKLPGIEALKA